MNRVLVLSAFALSCLLIFGLPFVLSKEHIDLCGPMSVFDAAQAVILCLAVASAIGLLLYRSELHGGQLLQIFLAALLVRLVIGALIFVFDGQGFFGGDAFTYDFYGYLQLKAWGGDPYSKALIGKYLAHPGSAWGMVYFVGGIYEIVGRNMLAVQFLNAALGAATAPIIFLCTYLITSSLRASRLAALCVAFMPSLILWSSQGLKDGPIMFFLAFSILATLKLGFKFSLKYLLALIAALFCVLAFRFYVFYMLAAAIVGTFIIGMQPLSAQSLVRQYAIIIVIGLGLTYLGVTRYADKEFASFGSLAAVQQSRSDATQSNSGFAADADVSTAQGALSMIPEGLVNLLFAPFPWQLSSLRQSITAPEMLVWWASFPMLVLGVWYLIRYRWRQAAPMMIFTLMLTLAYSIFQGNVGNAYRQRAQLQIFYFIFVAVGWVLLYERREQALLKANAKTNALPVRPFAVGPVPTRVESLPIHSMDLDRSASNRI